MSLVYQFFLEHGVYIRVYIVCPLSVLLPVLANKDVHKWTNQSIFKISMEENCL